MCKKKDEPITLYNLLEHLKQALNNAEKMQAIRTYLLQRRCLICAAKLVGRSDRIYCGIRCKNKYHSEVRSSTKGIRSETMKTLMKNYQILEGLLGEKGQKVEVSRTQLAREGFQFDHATHVRQAGKRLRYRIFNREYEFVNTTKVRIFRNDEERAVSPFLFLRWERKYTPELLAQYIR